MWGLSRSNLNYMLTFAVAWPAEAIVQQPVGKLGWGHLMVLIDKLDDPAARDWYAAAADGGGSSRDILRNQKSPIANAAPVVSPTPVAREMTPNTIPAASSGFSPTHWSALAQPADTGSSQCIHDGALTAPTEHHNRGLGTLQGDPARLDLHRERVSSQAPLRSDTPHVLPGRRSNANDRGRNAKIQKYLQRVPALVGELVPHSDHPFPKHRGRSIRFAVLRNECPAFPRTPN